MPNTIFPKDNIIKADYGQWYFKRVSGKRHEGADVSTATAPFHAQIVGGGYVEFAGVAPKTAADPYTHEWGYHVRVFVGQKDAVRRAGTLRQTYAHMEAGSLTVRTGQLAAVGQALGTMGESGNAKGEPQGKHVHFQADRWNGSKWVNQDPAPYIGGTNTKGVVWYGENKEDGMSYYLELKNTRNNQIFETPDANGKVLAEKDAVKPGLYPVVQADVPGETVADTKWCELMLAPGVAGYAVYGGVVESGARLLEPRVLAREYGCPLGLGGDQPGLRPPLHGGELATVQAKLEATEAALGAEREARQEAETALEAARAAVNQYFGRGV